MLYALQRRDDPYLEIVDKYGCDRSRGERAPDLYKQAFMTLRYHTPRTGADLLGVLYETYGMASDSFGQYFTPHNVSRAMAEMQLADLDAADVAERREQDEPVTVQDPACGSGRLLVLAAQQLPAAQFWAVDKDATCAKMAAVNFQLHNVDGVVVHGDSLAVESYRTWQTMRTALGGMVREVDVDLFAESTESSGESGSSDKNEGSASVGGADVSVRDSSLWEFQ